MNFREFLTERNSEDITYLSKNKSPHSAVEVYKGNGKTRLYLNYYNGVATIRNGYAKTIEIFRGTREEIISQLQSAKYKYPK